MLQLSYIYILDLTPGFSGLGKLRQLQDETRDIEVLGRHSDAPLTNVRGLTVLELQ